MTLKIVLLCITVGIAVNVIINFCIMVSCSHFKCNVLHVHVHVEVESCVIEVVCLALYHRRSEHACRQNNA